VRFKILIVDDEESARFGVRKALQAKENILLEAGTLREARTVVEKEGVDLILLDINLPDGSGLDYLKELAADAQHPPVIIITAHGSERAAIDAIRAGASEYLTKPFEIDELRLLVRNARETARLAEENRRLKEELDLEGGPSEIVGRGDAMKRVLEMVDRVAPTDATVLVLGESGTGKELVARAIHRASPRAAEPFVAVNCAALPDSLIESELFGHEKGAFTGAIAPRKGKFELADGGTLFLDEIGDMAPATQAKVLRVLEDRRIERLGAANPIPVDVRIVCATHRDLSQAITEGNFRADLYYRIHVVSILIPPLRDRPDDIDLLLDHFGSAYAGRYRMAWRGFTEAALRQLRSYPWPGNVRELRNVVERSVVLSFKGPVDLAELPPEFSSGPAVEKADPKGEQLSYLPYEEARAAFERDYLLAVLERNGGNISQAAARMGIHRQTLQYKLKQLKIARTWSD